MPRRRLRVAETNGTTDRSAARRVPARLAVMLLGALATILTVAPVGAGASEDGSDGTFAVTVTAQVDAARRDIVRVDVAGLGPFADGTLAVYQCGNADAAGRPIEPTVDDCFGPGDDRYTTTPIGDEASVTLRYQIARDGIGASGARCIPTLDGAAPCQLVIGAVRGAEGEVVGVALDDALADLDEDRAADAATQPAGANDEVSTLPVTGLGPRGVAVALFAAAGCLYVGSLLRSATQVG